MQEIFIQEFWSLKILEGKNLRTTCGKSLVIRNAGQWNHYGGPDFLFAHITIDEMDWFGHIEIHQHTSDWQRHQHDHDPNYALVILHVVQFHDQKHDVGVSHSIPTLELKAMREFKKYLRRKKAIPISSRLFCGDHIAQNKERMRSLLLQSAKQRLTTKADYAFTLYQECRSSWLDVIYILMVRALGQQANADTMETMAKAAPYRIWFRLHNDFDALQSLFMGIAGFDGTEREFDFLSKKYGLTPLQDFQWIVGKVRPSSLPHNRVMQLIALLHRHGEKLNELHIPNENQYDFLQEKLEVQGENYSLSSVMAEGIIINAIVPYVYARARAEGNDVRMQLAMNLLHTMRPESNRITKFWLRCGYVPDSAAETQGMLYLYRERCSSARCEHCRFNIELHEPAEKPFL